MHTVGLRLFRKCSVKSSSRSTRVAIHRSDARFGEIKKWWKM